MLETTLGTDSIYTKTQPIQWMPWYHPGPSCGSPAAGDAYIEKTISVVPGYNRVFKVHNKITHFGTDAHGEATQELPVVYVNGFINKFWYYGGDAPWTNESLLKIDMPTTCRINLHTPENWGAYADGTGSGLAVYSPGQFPNSKGFTIGSANQFTPTCRYSWVRARSSSSTSTS